MSIPNMDVLPTELWGTILSYPIDVVDLPNLPVVSRMFNTVVKSSVCELYSTTPRTLPYRVLKPYVRLVRVCGITVELASIGEVAAAAISKIRQVTYFLSIHDETIDFHSYSNVVHRWITTLYDICGEQNLSGCTITYRVGPHVALKFIHYAGSMVHTNIIDLESLVPQGYTVKQYLPTPVVRIDPLLQASLMSCNPGKSSTFASGVFKRPVIIDSIGEIIHSIVEGDGMTRRNMEPLLTDFEHRTGRMFKDAKYGSYENGRYQVHISKWSICEWCIAITDMYTSSVVPHEYINYIID